MLFSLIIIFAVFVYYGIPYIYEKCSRKMLKDKAEKSGAFVLTFDDGPSDNLTLAILDLLEEHNARASFFLLGRNIAGRENIVRQIADRGHKFCLGYVAGQ